MPSEDESLRRRLRRAGLTQSAIDAVWPAWWSEEAALSLSATNELKFTLARRLGLSPRSLFEDAPQFVWRDEAKYKNLGQATVEEIDTLTSFGVAITQHALAATSLEAPMPTSASAIREAVLASSAVVGLGDILAFCWSVGVPVLQLRVFPLKKKLMHAMSVRVGDRHAILIGRETRFEAQAAYWVAHELGHVVLDHIASLVAFFDVDDPLRFEGDDEERMSNRFALEVLTGSPETTVEANVEQFSAAQLAHAALQSGPAEGIEPGVLALCLGHASGRWRQAMGALKLIPPGPGDVGSRVNRYAHQQFALSSVSIDTRDYLERVASLRDA